MGVLSVIGQILLIILYVVLALVVCLIVLPVVYKVTVKKTDDGPLVVNGVIRWLFGFLLIKVRYDNDGLETQVRIIGIRLFGPKKKPAGKKEKESDVYLGPERAKKQPTIKPGERTYKDTEAEVDAEAVHIDSENRKYFKDERVFVETERRDIGKKARLTIKRINDTIKLLRTGFRAIKAAMPYLIKLIKHILPKRIKGEAEFGFDDPSSTGKILGVIGVLYPVLPEKLEIIPNFAEKKFNCDLFIAGHLFLVYVAVYVIKILRLKEIKALLKRMKSRRRKNG